MAYGYQYLNEFKQFGIINYTLRLIDDEGVMPNVDIPVIINESELNDNNLENIAFSLKNLHTTRFLESIVIPSPVIEPEISTTIIDTVSSEETIPVDVLPVVEQPIQPETPVETV